MMNFRNKVQEIIEEKGTSIYQLNKDCPLSRNTILEIVNNPYKSFNSTTLETLALALDCNITDLLVDDWKVLYFEKIADRIADSDQKLIFSPNNLKVLDRLLSQLGIQCTFEPYSDFRALNIKEAQQHGSHHIDINMRIEHMGDCNRLTVVDFFFCTNKSLFLEEKLKANIIYLIECYALQIGFQEVKFYISNDYIVRSGTFYENGLNVEADYSYTLGTKMHLFTDQGYRFVPARHTEFQVSFQKEITSNP